MIKLKSLLKEHADYPKQLGDKGYQKDFKMWRKFIFDITEAYPQVKNAPVMHNLLSADGYYQAIKLIGKLKVLSPTAESTTGPATDYKIYNDLGLYIIFDWYYLKIQAYKQANVQKLGKLPTLSDYDIDHFTPWYEAVYDIRLPEFDEYTKTGTIAGDVEIAMIKVWDEYITWLKTKAPLEKKYKVVNGKTVPYMAKPDLPKHPRGFSPTQLAAARSAGWGDDVIEFYNHDFMPKSFKEPNLNGQEIKINNYEILKNTVD